jgi:hypothetical protein
LIQAFQFKNIKQDKTLTLGYSEVILLKLKTMKTLRKIGITAGIAIMLTLFNGFGNSVLRAQPVIYPNPPWAPAYYPGVRYYYIPDIETFYDLSNQDFVYLDDGQWLFSYSLPPMYRNFDLYDAFVVALDMDVFQPWMHFQFYLSNYPRYYYRSLFRGDELTNIRGFNENGDKAFYWTPAERSRVDELRRTAPVEKRTESSRPPQKSNYYGNNIGHHVKVLPQMRENASRKEGQRRR